MGEQKSLWISGRILFFLSVIGYAFCSTLFFSCGRKDSKSPEDISFVTFDTIRILREDTTLFNFLDKDTIHTYFDTLHINGKVYYISQGDILVDPNDFGKMLMQEIAERSGNFYKVYQKDQQDLVIKYDEGKKTIIKWENFPIKYCVRKKSFSVGSTEYDQVRDNMARAVSDWMGTCNVKFEYVAIADTAKDPEMYGIDFTVESVKPGSSLKEIAISFYPDDPKPLRVLRVLPGYWTTDKNKVGLLRHEIGHILGFQHEQAAYIKLAPLECRQYYPEILKSPRRISMNYDRYSVMHYFCGNAGTKDMYFSQTDSMGFVSVYGKK
ncbi:MAG TPA: hypothetical protein VGO58_12460 [Chitinophagaceae bacterium]|jgi:hypothetical protein|nr:hypothetical protein [Chitinophagaceae bacterium]